MHPDVQVTRETIDKAIESMTAEQMSWHPEGKWCSYEILEHLALTYGQTAKALSRVAEGGKSVASRPTLKQRIGIWVVCNREIIPGGRKAPERAVPRGLPADQVVPTIRENLANMDQAIAACEATLGTKIRIADHPILGPLTVKQWRTFHKVHTRHHMKQIAMLRAQMAQAKKASA